MSAVGGVSFAVPLWAGDYVGWGGGVSALLRRETGVWDGVVAGAEGVMERFWEEMPRDVTRAAIVALASIMVGAIWQGRMGK